MVFLEELRNMSQPSVSQDTSPQSTHFHDHIESGTPLSSANTDPQQTNNSSQLPQPVESFSSPSITHQILEIHDQSTKNADADNVVAEKADQPTQPSSSEPEAKPTTLSTFFFLISSFP
jgi:hypothetical protein